ncbi:P-II family nitrogen regulator [Methanoregula sp.]|uniref:P-II family nitrogen regulator n=1 Tax=Methanoregula sp. TaxID=2052170 RepID=UPI002B8691E1|nr:P-II family nitrogen regulator [Methanoregula sp.]HVP96903.1 P-II family nitrogen regulator [Methanoregula sp.]
MKKIIAIIRNEKVEETKSKLEKLGVTGITFLHVTGRGERSGRIESRLPGAEYHQYVGKHPLKLPEDVPVPADPVSRPAENEREPGFRPQRMLVIVANDSDVRPIIATLIATNYTGHHGDGAIFVCPMISAIRVRNGEQGDRALV